MTTQTPQPFKLTIGTLPELTLTIEAGRYPYGGGTYVALNLVEPGAPTYGPAAEKLAILSTNIAGVSDKLPFGDFTRNLEDTYDQLLEALEQAGYLQATDTRLRLSFNHDRADARCTFPIYRLTDKARTLALLDERWDGDPAPPHYPVNALVVQLQPPKAWLEYPGHTTTNDPRKEHTS